MLRAMHTQTQQTVEIAVAGMVLWRIPIARQTQKPVARIELPLPRAA